MKSNSTKINVVILNSGENPRYVVSSVPRNSYLRYNDKMDLIGNIWNRNHLDRLPNSREGLEVKRYFVKKSSNQYTDKYRTKTREVIDYKQEFYKINNLPLSDQEAEFIGLKKRNDGKPYRISLKFPNDNSVDIKAIKQIMTDGNLSEGEMSSNSFLLHLRKLLRTTSSRHSSAEADILSDVVSANPDKPIHISLGSSSNAYFIDEMGTEIHNISPSRFCAIIDLTENPNDDKMKLRRSYSLPSDHVPYFFENPTENEINLRLKTDVRPLTDKEKLILHFIMERRSNTFRESELEFMKYIIKDAEGNVTGVDRARWIADQKTS